MDKREVQLQSDVVSIQKIPIISTLLDVISRTTGMGFTAVSRVTEDKWITCSLIDKINFGLKPGDELKIETTICNEVRKSGKAVIIDNVSDSGVPFQHLIPPPGGFKSYISVPIIRHDGSFFGTLCAFDLKPAKLHSPEVIGMFNLFADLISFHLQSLEQVELSELKLLQEREERTKALEQKNIELQKMNVELESFAQVASHDLQEPLRKIETFSNFILEKDYDNLSANGKHYFNRLMNSVTRMQTLIRDLIMYTQVKAQSEVFVKTDIKQIIEDVKQNYSEEINQKGVIIELSEMCTVTVIPFQFEQLLQNLISNSIKFSKQGVNPVIHISSSIEKGDSQISNRLSPDKLYCHIVISDNGIGFDPEHSDKIFEVFQRLNGREEYEGTGIGLSIVKKIVDNHKGFITATGELNKGARFDIYIPSGDDTFAELN